MSQCPVCQTELGEKIPEFCNVCGWETGEDIYLQSFLNAPSAYDIEKYNRRLENAKRIWKDRKKAESEKIKLQRSLEEKKQKELETMRSMSQNQIQTLKQNQKTERIKAEHSLKKKKSFFIVLVFIIALTITVSIWYNQRNKLNDIQTKMIYVEGGTFLMGSDKEYHNMSSKSDSFENNLELAASLYLSYPVHNVKVSSFCIGKYEVTQKEWFSIMEDNPAYFKGNNSPVENITWYQAVEFCNKLSLKEGLYPVYNIKNNVVLCNWQANGYRLPTEAEWEYAARGGNLSKGYLFSGSNILSEVAWYKINSSGKTHEVGKKKANELGIYDMSGNVREWCWDIFEDYSPLSQYNPQGGKKEFTRINRGGCWYFSDIYSRVVNRRANIPDSHDNILGLRLARNSNQQIYHNKNDTLKIRVIQCINKTKRNNHD